MADRPSITLLSNASATGGATAVPQGRYAFAADGTFNGGTVKLQILSPDGSSYIDIGGDATLSAEGVCLVDLPHCTVKGAVTGSPSAIYATLSPVDN